MKRHSIIYSALAAVSVLLLAGSCDDFLDIKQDNKLSASNMWEDANDVITSANGIYYRMRSCFVSEYTNVYFWGELRVGDFMWGPSLTSNVNNNDMIAVRKSTMNSSTVSCNWSSLYTAIDQANAVLKYARKVDMTDEEKGFCIGQASFARAYCYFWAARLWGDVPLNLNPVESIDQEETYPTRTPKAEVYAQIKADIDTAAAHAEELGVNKYLATSEAVDILKAEYGLWMYRTQNAGDQMLSYAREALDHIGISRNKLLDDYASVFSRTNKINKEVVFALNNNQEERLLGGYYNFWYFPSNLVASTYRQNPVPISSTQWLSYSQEFLDSLLASKALGDMRVDCNLGYGNYGSDGETISWPNKYLGDMTAAQTILDCDILYYRYAYAVMLDAEAKYYAKDYAGALSSLNIIADRAYGNPIFYTDESDEAVLDAITREYFLEFPGEGIIWFALIRLDKIWEYNPDLLEMKANNPNILLWPISMSSINKNNKLVQTEGWS